MSTSLNQPFFYYIRFEGLPELLYIGKASKSREARWSEHSKSFRMKKAAPNMQRLYDLGHKVIYGRITYTLLSLPPQAVFDMEREVMSHAIEVGYTLLNVVSMKQVAQQNRLDRENALIQLNVFRSNSNDVQN